MKSSDHKTTTIRLNDDTYNKMMRDSNVKTIDDLFTLWTIEYIIKQSYLSDKAKVLAIKSTIEKNRPMY